METRDQEGILWTRRGWLAAMAVGGLGSLGAGKTDVDAILARMSAASLKNQGIRETEHYVAVGDAPEDFQAGALHVCEGLAKTLQKFLLTKGIEIPLPASRMAVVVLLDRASYNAFKGEDADGAEGGHYDLDSNRLVIFQTDQPRVNTFTLVHEATHQLTYNTGLLSRLGDVPVAVSEGLATFGEVWRKDRPTLARPNMLRLAVLRNPGKGRLKWIPLERLLTDDGLFEDEATEQLAYAESCLWIYDLLQTREGAKQLSAYLAAIKGRTDGTRRVEDAEAAFGNLGRLDSSLKTAARKIR